jgi:hypothetical protein
MNRLEFSKDSVQLNKRRKHWQDLWYLASESTSDLGYAVFVKSESDEFLVVVNQFIPASCRIFVDDPLAGIIPKHLLRHFLSVVRDGPADVMVFNENSVGFNSNNAVIGTMLHNTSLLVVRLTYTYIMQRIRLFVKKIIHRKFLTIFLDKWNSWCIV